MPSGLKTRLCYNGLTAATAMPKHCGRSILTVAGERPRSTLSSGHASAQNSGLASCSSTSMDADGQQTGYDCDLLSTISSQVSIPLIASGGAGTPDHFVKAVTDGGADAVLAASLFHYGDLRIQEVKSHMAEAGLPMRMIH